MRVVAFLYSYFYVTKYRIYHAFKRRPGINTEPREIRVIVSLTSYPARLQTVFLSIESLLNQTFSPDRVILWLSADEILSKNLPDNLLSLQSRGLEIRLLDENIRSYKKLVYAAEEFSGCHIVTCDDDVMVPKWFLSDLYQSYRKYPDCISTYRCRVIQKVSNTEFAPYLLWKFSDVRKPSHDNFANGGGGTWYPPGTLNKELSNRLFMKLAPDADDIWFKAMGMLNNTKIAIVRKKSIDFPYIQIGQTQAKTLWKTNIHENDRQLKAVFDHFDLHRLISESDVKVSSYPLKRIFDIAFGIFLLPILILPMILLAAVIKIMSKDSVLYWSNRVGKDGVVFSMPKFRTIKENTSDQTHSPYINFIGGSLRLSSLDELPQIFSIFRGQMSFVGPRPIIPEEDDLIRLRKKKYADRVLPGLTGWAQINGRDRLTPVEKVAFDLEYVATQSLWLDVKILLITIIKVIKRENISL